MRPETIEYNNGLPVNACVRRVEQYPYHWHDALEIVQVLEGSVNIGMGDHNLVLRENDVAIVNMDEIHRMTGTGQGNKVLHIYVSPEFMKRAVPNNRYLFIYCCSAYHEDEARERYDELRGYIARLKAALNAPPRDRKAIEALLQDMLDYTVYSFDLLRWGFGTTPLDEWRVERLRQIAERVSGAQETNMKLKDMLSIIDVTLSHLSYDIKETFGRTFQELLYDSKCAEAAKLLLGTDKRIVDIALSCGFSDVKYLIKHFKRSFTHTPSEFRRLYRADGNALAAQTRYKELPFSEAVRG